MALQNIKEGFGVVTVINAKCVSISYLNGLEEVKGPKQTGNWTTFCKTQTPEAIAQFVFDNYAGALKEGEGCYIDTLKVANLNMEGPSKTITGGQYANPLIKFGKTMTCELQDALGHPDALKLLGGMEVSKTADGISAIHATSKFGKPVAILGDTFIIDRETGDQVPVSEIIYQYLPDSIINLAQAAEGDATVFDLNGSVMATDVADTESTSKHYYYGAFYSIINEVVGGESSGD